MITLISFFENIAFGLDRVLSGISIAGLNLKAVVISIFIVSCVLSLVEKKSAN